MSRPIVGISRVTPPLSSSFGRILVALTLHFFAFAGALLAADRPHVLVVRTGRAMPEERPLDSIVAGVLDVEVASFDSIPADPLTYDAIFIRTIDNYFTTGEQRRLLDHVREGRGLYIEAPGTFFRERKLDSSINPLWTDARFTYGGRLLGSFPVQYFEGVPGTFTEGFRVENDYNPHGGIISGPHSLPYVQCVLRSDAASTVNELSWVHPDPRRKLVFHEPILSSAYYPRFLQHVGVAFFGLAPHSSVCAVTNATQPVVQRRPNGIRILPAGFRCKVRVIDLLGRTLHELVVDTQPVEISLESLKEDAILVYSSFAGNLPYKRISAFALSPR